MDNADGKRRTPRTRTKLWLGMLALVVLMGMVALIVIRQQSTMERSFALLDHLDTLERLLLECRRQEKNFLLREDQASLDLHASSFEALRSATADRMETIADAGIRSQLAVLLEKEVEYHRAFEHLKAEVLADPSLRHDPPEERTVARARECHALLADLRELAISRFAKAHSATHTVSVLSVALGLVASVAIAGWLTRHLVAPLEYLRELAARISTGDIQDMDVELSDLDAKRFNTRESWELAESLQRMVTSIRLLIPTERGLMDDYHMTVLVLVNKAVGPGGWTVIERARQAAGFGSFAEVRPDNVDRFLERLREEAASLIPEERIRRLSAAIARLPEEPAVGLTAPSEAGEAEAPYPDQNPEAGGIS